MNGGYESLSDEGDPPLSSFKIQEDPLGYESLCHISPKVINCEFCDRTFKNQLTAIKHNQRHIIIPLIRQSLIQCPTCLYFFTTWKSFNEHNLNKHEQSKTKNRLQNLIRFEEDFNVEDNLNDNEVFNGVHINPLKVEELIVLSSDDEPETEIFQCHSDNKYENLVKEDCFKCSYCNSLFLTRYELLVHNLCHLKVNSELHLCKYCDIYFENKMKLKNHLNTEHQDNHDYNYTLHKCRECNLIYNSWVKHHLKYHELHICSTCKPLKYFKKKKDFNDHMRVHFNEDYTECEKCGETVLIDDFKNHELIEHKPINVCQICTLFVRSNNGISYIKVGSHTVDGDNKIACEKCSNLCLNLNVLEKVKTTRKYKTKKSRSNADRLKTIHKKLKFLKQLNKY